MQIVGAQRLNAAPLGAEDGTKSASQDPRGHEEGQSEQQHPPGPHRRGHRGAISQPFGEGGDCFGDGIVGFALGQHDGVGDLQHGEGEGQQCTGGQVGGDQGQGDQSSHRDPVGPQAKGGFFKFPAGLLQTCRGRTHHVGQSPDGIGNHQQRNGVGFAAQDVEEGLQLGY